MRNEITRRTLLAGLAAPAGSDLRWSAGPVLLKAQDRDGDSYHAIKDPSVVQHNGQWHLFCSIRGGKRSHQIEYVSLKGWDRAASARRVTMKLTGGYYCAPQVFYFRPHKKWYLVYQVIDQSRQPALQPAFSTTSTLDDPFSWTPPELLFSPTTSGLKSWIDFWVISDSKRSHLFFTTLDGRMWRAETRLDTFPHGWGQPAQVLQDDIYEASHTYRLKGEEKYLTIVEAQGEKGRRYFKSYLADQLDGEWRPLAASRTQAFAFPDNVTFAGERWTDSFSHGELLRDSNDETLTVDPARLRFLIQGVADAEREGKKYGDIPWRLGLLTAVTGR